MWITLQGAALTSLLNSQSGLLLSPTSVLPLQFYTCYHPSSPRTSDLKPCLPPTPHSLVWLWNAARIHSSLPSSPPGEAVSPSLLRPPVASPPLSCPPRSTLTAARVSFREHSSTPRPPWPPRHQWLPAKGVPKPLSTSHSSPPPTSPAHPARQLESIICPEDKPPTSHLFCRNATAPARLSR